MKLQLCSVFLALALVTIGCGQTPHIPAPTDQAVRETPESTGQGGEFQPEPTAEPVRATSRATLRPTLTPAGNLTATETLEPAPTARPPATPTKPPAPATPLSLISRESLFAFLEELTGIQAYSGWRNSASEGEAQALEYVAGTLDGFDYLHDLGLELERTSFHVFLATELWDTRLYLTTQGKETEVPVDAPRGHRHDVAQALRFDSDGVLNDSDRNPVEVDGPAILVRSVQEIDQLDQADLQDRIVFLDSAAITLDPAERHSGAKAISDAVARLVDQGAAGLVLVTSSSDGTGKSQGKFVGDGTLLERVQTERVIPSLYVRLEDLAPASISTWQELEQIEAARLVWDTDVFSPGTSGNLIARIPGEDPSQAIILGAHIDSANSPGALDNGVNSAVLMEVARILNEAQTQPPVDVYLVWFGSEELWVYGSQHFVNTQQELLDRTLAAFVMDSIIVSTPHPLLVLDGWSHSRFGDPQLAFPRYLSRQAGLVDIRFEKVEDYQGIGSDNGVFNGFVPTAGFAFGSSQGDLAHSPYDSADAAQDLGDLMEQVTAVALIAALETGRDLPDLHVTPEPDRRALILASHTEVLHMTPSTLIDLDRALAWEGFDVDVIPYGQTVTAADLAGADLVVVLPVIDLPGPGGDLTLYDEAWRESEIESLVAYVEQGGLLVLANSAHRVLMGQVFDANEDGLDLNALSGHFGILFEEAPLPSLSDRIEQEHPLTRGLSRLPLIADNGLPFTMQTGETLAQVGGKAVLGLVQHGEAGGQVLVLADMGTFGIAGFMPTDQASFDFVRNLAHYAASR